ncbi:MAG: helix-turn-helix domain-containing protein [Elusimicrobia bacterium]|nr:helix-turn-helix domain-containing protein [Elusimicrobiota bacterium]
MIPNSSGDPLRRLQTPLVPEIKAEIGAALKAARLKRAQSLEAVSQQTRISKRFLEALEGNKFEEFPALAYLRGFLKSYCDYLELDFEAFWKAIQTDAPPAQPEPAAPAAAAPAAASRTPKAPQAPAPARVPAHGPASAAEPALSPENEARAAWRAAFFAAALAAAVGLVISRGPSRAGKDASLAPSPLLQPLRAPTEPRLVAEFRSDSWVAVAADGAALFEGRVPRNSRLVWKAKKSLTLRTPQPAALKLTLNDAPYALGPVDAAGAFTIESP